MNMKYLEFIFKTEPCSEAVNDVLAATLIMLLPSWRMEQDEWMHSMESLKGLLPGYGAVALKEAKHVQAAG
jgi:hypothetical protein